MNNQDIDIKNLQFTSEDTGSFFSKTYTEYNWKFTLDGIQRSITLYHSKILGRRTIYLGKQEICRYQRYTYNFKYSFPIDTHNISIIQSDDSYILRIDEVPFNRLLNEQKLRRFNIIKETFLEKEQMKKDKKKRDREIRKFRTFNKNGGIPISLRTNNQRNIYRTNIYSSNREIEENLNIENENDINTSSKRNNNDVINNFENGEKGVENENKKVIFLNPEQYDYYYDEEYSDDISNKAIDGGDSDKDEDEDDNEETDDKTIQESFRPPEDDIFKTGNDYNDDDNDNDNEPEDFEENNIKNDDNNIDNNIDKDKEENEEQKNEVGEEDEKDEKDKGKQNINNYNKIINELQPIKSKKKEKHLKKIKIDSKKDKKKIKNKNNDINNIENNINNDYNYNNNNDNNINNENNNIDLLGEEIYNSSRDKDLYNNVDNNLNINYLLSQGKQNYSDYKSNNPSNPFEDESIKTN